MTHAELARDARVGRGDDAQVAWPVRRLVLARDNWACLCCDQPVLGRAYAIHLRKARHLGGDMSPENLITVLAECGERISTRRDPADDARGDDARGYVLGSCDIPALVPVAYSTAAGQTRAWLLPDGGRAFVPPLTGRAGLACTGESSAAG